MLDDSNSNDQGQDSDILLVKEEPAPFSGQQIIPIEFSGDHQIVNTSNGQAIVLTLDPSTLKALTGGNSQVITTSTSQTPVISSTQSITARQDHHKPSWPYVRRARRSGIAPDGSCVNQYGRHFANGRPLPESLRQEILKCYDQGVRPSQISRTLQVSHGCVSKILNRYRRNVFLTSEGQREYPTRATPLHVVEKIKEIKRELPHLVAWEIRLKLITDNICPPEKAPSISCITRILREYLVTATSEQTQSDGPKPEISSNMSTAESDSFSDISQLHPQSSEYSPTLYNEESIAQQQQQILTLLQEPLKNSLRPILPKLNHSNSIEDESAINDSQSNCKSDDNTNNPFAGLNASALITALLTLSGQPCGNPWEPLWVKQEHLLMTSNGSAMKQIVYMGNNLWQVKDPSDNGDI